MLLEVERRLVFVQKFKLGSLSPMKAVFMGKWGKVKATPGSSCGSEKKSIKTRYTLHVFLCGFSGFWVIFYILRPIKHYGILSTNLRVFMFLHNFETKVSTVK